MADRTITIELNTRSETTGIKVMTGELATLKGAVESVGKGFIGLKTMITGTVAALTAAVTGGALGKGVEHAIENAAEMRKAAQRAAMDVEKLSALTLGKASDAENFAMPMKALAKWMKEAGVVGRDLTEVFLEQADVIKNTTEEDERLRLVQERFGRNGQQLLPILLRGSEALREQMHYADLFGVTIGPVFAKQSAEFLKNIKLIKLFGEGLFHRIAEEVLPSLLEISRAVLNWAKSNAETVGHFVQDATSLVVRSIREGSFGQLVSLVIEAAVDEGFSRGINAGVGFARALLEKLFSVDFLIYAAQAGRILAGALMAAVKVPVDLLSAGFEYVAFRFYNTFVELNAKAAGYVLQLYTNGFNAILKGLATMSPAMKALGFTFKPLEFNRDNFQRIAMQSMSVEASDFATIFADKQKESAEAIKSTLSYFDEQIAKTKELLTLGEINSEQGEQHVSALQKLVELLERESALRAAQNLAEQHGGGSAARVRNRSTIEEDQHTIDAIMRESQLDLQRLHTRGLILDASRQTVGSLKQEAESVRAVLQHMEQLALVKQRLTREMEDGGFLTGKEAREQELKDAQDLLNIQRELVQLKEQTNDFTFFEKFSRGIQDLADEFNHVGASIADVLVKGIGGAIDTVSRGLWQVIDGTSTWADLFRQVGREIISGLIKIAIQEIFLDNLKRGIMFAWKAMVSAFRASDVAEANATEAAKTPALASNALLSSIESYGVAVAIGVAAIAAILASVGAFEAGGVVKGGRQLIQVNENGTEAVLNARATALLGEGFINDLNSGVMTGSAARSEAARSSVGSDAGSPIQVHVLLVDDARSQEARDYIESSGGRAHIARVVRSQRTEIGIS